MAERPTLAVPSPPGGWAAPWPNVAEIAAVIPCTDWTLVGGLMTQLHAAHRGIWAVRPTDDVDIVLHVERNAEPSAAASALEALGYTLVEPMDPREKTAHRFRRGGQLVDVVTGDVDVVDVLMADHVPPRQVKTLRGRQMVAIEGGTQALQRTVNATLTVVDGAPTVVSVPSVLGALILKVAAFQTDSRDPERHLADAAVLLASLDDPFEARAQFKGSDRARIGALRRNLDDRSALWLLLDEAVATNARAALRVLAAGLD